MKKLIYILILVALSCQLHAGVFDNLQFTKIATGFQFTEGPAWHPDGYLLFSDIDGNKIYKWTESQGTKVLTNPSGNANGLIVTRSNDLFVCRQGSRDVAKMDTLGKYTVKASQWNAKKFNSPNDVALSYLGSVYFTDPDFGATNRELTFEGLFCLPYNSSTVVLLDSTLIKPNGLTFVQDWKTLYVCESSTNKVYTYTLTNESKTDISKNKKVFVQVNTTGEIDGICADVFGNIFVACGNDGVKVYDKSANLVGSLPAPEGEKVRNLCFGGKYNNQLFITAGTSVYKTEIRYNGDFICTGLLGVPTAHSIVFNTLSDQAMDAYIRYGTDSTALDMQTPTSSWIANQPIEITLNNMEVNTKYYYQLFYRLAGQSTYSAFTSGSFTTQRAAGNEFSFAVEADPHLDENSNYYTFRNTLQNELNQKPDFMIDLGDNFMTEKFPLVNYYYVEQRNLLYRNFWDNVCNRMPLYIVIGNHEGELGWLNQSREDDEFNMTTAVRKRYYPNPTPGDFYTGNTTNELFVGQRENYYSWNWGDALFVVIDPYAYTTTKPGDAWGFTLGKTQYDWFRSTLENSKAKYKFVFSHQLVGGDKEGRGGSEHVALAEMGGYNTDNTYGFDDKRPGWGKPLHDIMKENGVQIFFHGHDHLYVEQAKDGVVYLEVPQPSLPNYTSTSSAAGYGYTTGVILPNSGHINVKVQNDSAVVEYISGYHVNSVSAGQINGAVKRRFSVKPTAVNTAVIEPDAANVQFYQSGHYVYVKPASVVEATLYLTDMTGRRINCLFNGKLEAETRTIELPANLNPGVYVAELALNHSTKNYKILYTK